MQIVELDNICDVITCGVAARPEYVESGVPFLSSLNVKENRILLNSYKQISKQDHARLTKYSKPEKGDILYTRVGSFGEAAVVNLDFEFSVFVSLTLIKPKKDLIDSRYLMWHLNSPLVRQFARNNTSGIGVQNLNVGVVRKYEVPLPPLPEQKKIAAILDAADELRQKDKALVEKYNELTQALFLDMFGDPVSNPKGWEKLSLKECTSKIGSGSTPRGGKESYHVTGISLIRSLNVYDNEFYYENLARISEEQAYKLKNVTVEKDDVLFNITGASVCRSTIVPEVVLPARVNQHVSILRPSKDKLNSIYLSHLMISESTKKQLLFVGSAGGAVMEAITKEQLEKYKVPIPKFDLQNKFAERIKVIEEQKSIAQACAQKSEELFNSLLQKAFNGGLV